MVTNIDISEKLGLVHQRMMFASQRIDNNFKLLAELEFSLYDEKKIKKCYKMLLGLEILKSMVEICNRDYSSYLIQERKLLEDISKQNHRLSRTLITARTSMKEEYLILMEISRILQYLIRDNNKGISYITTHLDEILKKVEQLRNKRLARVLKNFFITLAGLEADYLLKYRNEAISWRQKVVTMPFSYFFGISKSFLSGNPNIGYLGLVTYFKDEVISKRLDQKKSFRQLLNFLKIRDYIEKIRNQIENGLNQGAWQDFYSFWNHIEEVIKTLEESYGCYYFGEEIRRRKSEFGENPKEWLKLFNNIVALMNSTGYLRNAVIVPASQELQAVFTERIDELIHGKRTIIKQSPRLLIITSKDIKQLTLKILRKILSEEQIAVDGELKKMREQISAMIQRFESASKGMEEDVNSVMAFLNSVKILGDYLEESEGQEWKLAERLTQYKFRGTAVANLMRFLVPKAFAFGQYLQVQETGQRLLKEFERGSIPYFDHSFRVVNAVEQLDSYMESYFNYLKQELLPRFSDDFFEDLSIGNIQGNKKMVK